MSGESKLDHTGPATGEEDFDEDEIFAELEDSSNEPAYLRERRLQQLHAEFARAKALREQDHGTYLTMTSEKEVLDLTTSTKLSVVHFFKADFKRCRIMDSHLKTLSEWHLDTRFVRVDVEKAPWLVERLQIQILPCVISFINGKSVDRLLGFEGVGRGTDGITTRELEARLEGCGALTERKMVDEPAGKKSYNGITSYHQTTMNDQDEDDADDDWD